MGVAPSMNVLRLSIMKQRRAVLSVEFHDCLRLCVTGHLLTGGVPEYCLLAWFQRVCEFLELWEVIIVIGVKGFRVTRPMDALQLRGGN